MLNTPFLSYQQDKKQAFEKGQFVFQDPKVPFNVNKAEEELDLFDLSDTHILSLSLLSCNGT